MTIASPGRRLKERLSEGPILLPGAFNALSARLIEAAGFPAVYISGAGLSNGVAGLPDIGLLTATEVVTEVRHITSAVGIPAVADADTGFGEGAHFLRTAAAFESAGTAAIQIEDQVFPKRCGHLSGKRLVPAAAMAAKIRAAAAARTDPDFMIIARTDARGVSGLQEAIDRAIGYREAGADILFPDALASRAEFARFAQEVNGTLMANMTEFGKSPPIPASDLFDMGYRIVLFPMSLLRLAAWAMETGLQILQKEGSTLSLLERMQTREALYRLIRYEEYIALDRTLAFALPKNEERHAE